MRSVFVENRPLAPHLFHQSDFKLLQVAQPAMNQLSGFAAGAGSEIVFVNQGNTQSAGSRVQRNARARDAATDDEEVESLGRKLFD